MSVQVIVLAAGEGTRMKSGHPKVLNELAGRSMVQWVIDAAATLSPDRIVVVVGHEADTVRSALPEGVDTVKQPERLGTGHATSLALEYLDPPDDATIVVVPGDAPLITGEMLSMLLAAHGSNAATLATTVLDDATGYGRVLREGDVVTGIVEHADANEQQRQINEVGTSVYAFAAQPLASALTGIDADNASGELYLTDAVGSLVASGHAVGAVGVDLAVVGVNSFDQLAAAAEIMRMRINTEWMRQGVSMLDPARTYIDAAVELAPGARILPGVHIEGASSVGPGAVVGPDCHIRDSRIGEDCTVTYSVLAGAELQTRAQVGPYAYLRAGTVLGPESKAGTHVELKNATLAAGAKVPHLSYIGDATIGEDANIGAGSITCNWDGYDKHHTTIGARARIGSDTMLVAPVEIGEDGWTGAGSVITHDVAPGSLGVERSPQKDLPGYAEKRRKRAEGNE